MPDNDPVLLIDAFVRGRQALQHEANAVGVDDRVAPCVGHWDVRDVLAHLIGWDHTNVAAIAEIRAGRLPPFYEHYDPGWVTYNAELVGRYGCADWQSLLAALARSQAAVVSLLRSLSKDELTAPGPPRRGRRITIAGILRAAVRDEQEHTRQLRGFVARQQRRAGTHP